MTLRNHNIRDMKLATGNWLFAACCLLLILSSCNDKVSPSEISKEKPALYPDYSGVTIPATIAPLNFKVKEDYTSIDAVIEGKNN